MTWPDAINPVIYRKITFVLYVIVAFMYILFFINFPKEQKYSSYLSTLYVKKCGNLGFDSDVHGGNSKRQSKLSDI